MFFHENQLTKSQIDAIALETSHQFPNWELHNINPSLVVQTATVTASTIDAQHFITKPHIEQIVKAFTTRFSNQPFSLHMDFESVSKAEHCLQAFAKLPDSYFDGNHIWSVHIRIIPTTTFHIYHSVY